MKQNNNKLDRMDHIIHCIDKGLSESESLAYLKSHGYPMEKTKFYKLLKKLREHRINFIKYLLSDEFRNKEKNEMETLPVIKKEYWKNYDAESDPLKKFRILKQILNLVTQKTTVDDLIKYVRKEQKILQKFIKDQSHLNFHN
ncbi:hypothetical protein NKOR_08020 [Candidatus Nitrosopumilus koreensis AR1]|uniref:Uncharacterized protein n=1 Tax=Candidatus Nitrosopumilus koreensis AR1 TaxID=1229908 RepID=K0B934_9ARCH|nr:MULTISPECIES: hypothetical protein [Nitrosopumilus]AFS81465.1 hypothetical protein NKOR_08020 [Candidatus Nitrosopumilus koreensis AR1]